MMRRWPPILALAVACAVCPRIAQAQAGPPLMTNDTGTPGDGHWEINLAASGEYSGGAWNASAPDADINYGLGERIQLTIHPGWAHRTAPGSRVVSGIAPTEFAVRWRFLDQDKAGVDLAVQPHLVFPGPRASVRNDLSPPGREFVLPIQMVRRWNSFTTGIEVARHWVERERGALQVGTFVAKPCGRKYECLAEINSTHDVGERTTTMAGLGARRVMSDRLKLMAAVERQINGASSQRANAIYLGIQVTP